MSFKNNASFMPGYRPCCSMTMAANANMKRNYQSYQGSNAHETSTMAKGWRLGDHHANFS